MHSIIPGIIECVRCCYTTACCRRVVFPLQLLQTRRAIDLQSITEDSPSGILKVVSLHVLPVHTYVQHISIGHDIPRRKLSYHVSYTTYRGLFFTVRVVLLCCVITDAKCSTPQYDTNLLLHTASMNEPTDMSVRRLLYLKMRNVYQMTLLSVIN